MAVELTQVDFSDGLAAASTGRWHELMLAIEWRSERATGRFCWVLEQGRSAQLVPGRVFRLRWLLAHAEHGVVGWYGELVVAPGDACVIEADSEWTSHVHCPTLGIRGARLTALTWRSGWNSGS